MGRRAFLGQAFGTAAVTALAGPSRVMAQGEAAGLPVDQQFSFDLLTDQMRAASAQSPGKPQPLDGFLSKLDYDAYQRIRFRPDHGRWSDDAQSSFQLHAFHMGWLFKEPVHLFEIVDGRAAPMQFSTADFEYSGLKTPVPEGFTMPGVAGFRLHTPLNRADTMDELVAFLGASYFRALGRDNVYGLSARGLAVNTGLPDGEEFPRFTDFWLERPAPGADHITLYAALRSASVTAAYRFVITPGVTTTMEVTARIFPRNDIAQLGIAPLTSMFLFGGADPGGFDDFRPAVHDSDGLILNMRGGESFYRPLTNPPRLASAYLGAENPASFGLVQRARAFDQFLDAQAHYERRPSLMVEPLGDWGRGHVRLLEIPSDLEGNDNIVAYWIPGAEVRAGDALEYRYRLHWGMSPPGAEPAQRARILRTRIGKGGVSGVEGKTDRQKFVIDFAGGLLSALPADTHIEPRVGIQNGTIDEVVLARVSGTDTWRLVIEARADPNTTAELKAAVAGYGQTLTETWLYQWVKP